MINFYGAGKITAYIEKSGKSPCFEIILKDNSDTSLKLKLAYSLKFKKIIENGERICFEGYLNEDGIVEAKNIYRAYLEPLCFNFISENEDVFSYSRKGLFLKVDVKTPKHNFTYKTFEFLAKAGNNDVLNRLIGVLNNKNISLKGIFKNNVGMITRLEKRGS